MNSRMKQEELSGHLNDVRIGIESESLRVTDEGTLSSTHHPFDAADSHFTKDFAESQLEIVTEAYSGTAAPLRRLASLTAEADGIVAPERLWPLSMPPNLPEDGDIAIARFGESESGRRKHLYRKGLAARYGKKRQLICGIHVNISMGEGLLRHLVTETPGEWEQIERLYLNSAGRFYRDMDVLILLTGNSPIAGGLVTDMTALRPPVISVRNGNGGYGGVIFSSYIDLSSVSAYVEGMERGIRRESPEHRRMGLVEDGRLIQLSKSVFQSEKEFYAPIRLRSAVRRHESQIQALKRLGPGYLELRFLDKDPFVPGGIGLDSLNLIHLLFLNGLTTEDTPPAMEELSRSLSDARWVADMPIEVLTGYGDDGVFRLMGKARDLLVDLRPLAGMLDEELDTGMYTDMLDRQLRRLQQPETLPSAILDRRFRDIGTNWTGFGLKLHELSYARV